MADFLGFLSGGLAGSVITTFAKTAWEWFASPEIKCEHGDAILGSIVFVEKEGSKTQWIRLKVNNTGRSTAKNCSVIIQSISHSNYSVGASELASEVTDCNWAHIEVQKIDIPRQTWRYADLLCMGMLPDRDLLIFTGKGSPRLPPEIPGGISKISLKLSITSDNYKTIQHIVNLRYDGLGRGMVFE